MLNRKTPGLRPGSRKVQEKGSYRRTMTGQGFGMGGRETRGAGSKPEPNKTGMPLKRRDMPKCDRPIQVFDKGGAAGDFALRDAGGTIPIGPRYALATRYENSDQNKPKPVIFRSIYRLERKSARFSANLNPLKLNGFVGPLPAE